MPKKPSVSVRTTLYRLVGVGSLRDGIRDKYFAQGFSETAVSVAGRDALLVMGSMTSSVAKWAPIVYALTSESVGVGNETPAASLLIRDGTDDAWALTYGMGFQLLEPNYFDPGFGQRIAIRSADPAELSSVTRTTLDQRSKVDRLSIPSGDHLRNFGVGDIGEFVTRLVAKAQIPGLTDTSKSLTLRGADALNIPLGRKPADLVSDLDTLTELLTEAVKPGLEMLEQLTIVKHDPELIAALDLALDTAIGAPTGKRIGLAWPHEQTEENRPAVGYRVLGLGRGKAGPFDDLPTLDDLIRLVSSESAGRRVERLRKLRIQLLSEPDGDDTVVASSAIPATKWIAFETDHDSRRYFLHNGSWYLMDQDYAERLKAQTKVILSRSPGFIMPDWPASINREEDYNKQAASVLGGLVLDQKLAYTTLHRRGIELCDLLLSDGTLVHVKKLRRSDAASHQIAQALVSSDALLYDEDARTKFGAVIGKAGGGAEWKPEQLKKVVLAMARPGPLTEDTLFTFTQVTLVRSVTALQERGVEVFVAPIQLTP